MNCNILVLEDEPLIALDIAMTLEEAGYNDVVICHSIKEATELLVKITPKIALLDFSFKNGTTSVSVAKQLKESNTPFIFLTGNTQTTIKTPDELQPAAHINKPFQGVDLVTKVQRVLNVPQS